MFWIAVAIVLALGGGLYLWRERAASEEPAQAPALAQQAPAPEAAVEEPAPAPGSEPQVRHPVAEVESPPGVESKALPALDQSDEVMQQSLAGAIGKQSLNGLSLSPELIRHLVATVDSLPRQHVATRLLPLRPPPGRLGTISQQEVVALSPDNYARYTRYVKLAQAVDTKKLAAVYMHFYPLFQQAYAELGYPNRYFNDRLVEVIDHLLVAPEVEAPAELVQFGPLFQFADPDLEDLSAGQKLLIRIGPENAAVVKSKLRDLRREVASASR